MGLGVIRELVTKFGFDVDERPINAAEKAIQRVQQAIAGIAVGVIAKQFIDMANSAAAFGDGMSKGADKAGTDTQTWQEYAVAARLANVETGSLASGFRNLLKNADQAKRKGGETAEAFARIGITSAQLKGPLKDSKALFDAVAKGLTGVANADERAALEMALLGKSGQDLRPLLKDLEGLKARAGASGLIMSDEDLAKARAFDDAMGDFSATMEGLKNTIGVALFPTISKVVKKIGDWVKEHKELIKTKAELWFGRLEKAITKVGEVVDKIAKGLGSMETAIKGAVFAAGIMLALAYGPTIAGVLSLNAAWVLVGLSAKAAAAASMLFAMWPVILAAVIALIAEDIYGFFNGQDSLIGEYIKKWGTWGDILLGIAFAVKAPFDILAAIATAIAWSLSQAVDLARWLTEYTAKENSPVAGAKGNKSVLNPFNSNPLQGQELKEPIYSSIFKGLAGLTGGNWGASGPSVVPAGGNVHNAPLNLTVNIPSGTPLSGPEVGSVVEDAVRRATGQASRHNFEFYGND